MKTFLSFLLFIGVMVQGITAAAQTTVTVGTGTTFSGFNSFIATSTTTNKYSKSIGIYSAAEILAAGGLPGNITKLAYNKAGGDYTTPDATLNIFIKAVPFTTHASTPITWATEVVGATQVYGSTTHSFTSGDGWKEITLTTPFLWNGTDNLEIFVDWYRPSSVSPSMNWQHGTVTDANAITYNTTGVSTVARNANRPNVQFTIAPSGPCTAPPSAPTAVASVTTICPNTDFTLSSTGGSLGTGQTYQWESSPNGSAPWTAIGTPAATSSLTLSQTSTKFYRLAVTCSGQTAHSNAVQVVTNGTPVSGTFTINKNNPASATNFQTISAAIASLECGGVNGPVTFNVVANSGPYNEKVTIPAIPGASATSKVTINGNGNTLSFANTTTDRAVLRLDGADFITITNLTIQATDAAYGWGIHLLNGADNNTITNNTINIASTSATEASSVGIVFSNSTTAVSTAGNTGNNNLITNNTIIGGYKGIHLNGLVTGTGLNQITGNTIKDFYAYGIEVSAAKGTLVENNDISRALRPTTGTFYGIYLSAGSISTQVSKNRIHNTNDTDPTGTVYGLYITASDATAGTENVFSNNLVYNLNTTGTIYGIYNSNSDGAKYFHNTVIMDNLANTGIIRGFYQTGAATSIVFQNNIIVIKSGATGAKHTMYFATATSTINSNGNVLFLTGGASTSGIGYLGANQLTLADWQTASSQDANSVVADPQFANIATGDLTPTNVAVNNIGRGNTGIATDIMGLARNPNAPDPGAYEFMNNTTDVGITAITSPNSTCGLSANETITVVVTNFGTTAQSNIPVSYTINGGTPVTATIAGPLAPGVNLTYSFTTQANLSAQGGYTIVAQTGLTGDLEPTNNATTKVVANSRFTTLPQLNFETNNTGLASMRLVTNTKSAGSENAAASLGTGSTKGMILEGTTNVGWVMPIPSADPWTMNPDHFAAAYICFDPQGAANPSTPLWLSFDLKQTYKTANANTNFRVTVNGTQVGPTYRPPFNGTPIDWQKVYVDLTPYKNAPSIEIGFESSAMEAYANGTGTGNLIDNVQIVRLDPTGVKDNVLASSINVYPNPSTGAFTVALPQGKAFELEVTDLTGKVILKQAAKTSVSKVDLQAPAKGIYILKITSEGNTATKKLVIQ